MSILRQTRDWLTPHEAAEELSEKGDTVSATDVLRLALDGHLKLSVRLPAGTMVWSYRNAADTHPVQRIKTEGLWDLPMTGAGRRQVEHLFNRMSGLPYVDMKNTEGADIERYGQRCRLIPDPGASGVSPRSASALSDEIDLVIRRRNLDGLIQRITFQALHDASVPQRQRERAHREETKHSVVNEAPLGTRERRTLHLIISALAKEAKLDLSKASKAGETISALVAEMGESVAPNTIARHLRNLRSQVPGKDEEAN